MTRQTTAQTILLMSFLSITGCGSPHHGECRCPTDNRTLPRHYTCHRTKTPIHVDGRLDDAAWSKADWSADFADIQGFDHPTPRFKTHMKMLWDADCLYIAAELEEPYVWATLKQHDEIVFNDNDFEIFIDPNGDSREYYEIEVNALNTIFDLFLVRKYLDGGPALHDWNMRDLKSAIHVDGTLNDASDTDKGWTVEFALPWRSLKEAAGCETPPIVGDTWRMNFSRVEWNHQIVDGNSTRVPKTAEDNWIWSPQGVIDMHRPEHWGYVHFASDAAISK